MPLSSEPTHQSTFIFLFNRKSKYVHDVRNPKLYLAAVVLSLLSFRDDVFIVFWQMSLLCNLTRNFSFPKLEFPSMCLVSRTYMVLMSLEKSSLSYENKLKLMMTGKI